jgi:hypothetical protein
MDLKQGAMRIFRSWMEACGTPCEVRNGDVYVNNQLVDIGSKIRELNSTNLKVSMGAFHDLTESVGIGKPNPVDRGEAPTQKVYSDPVLARLRHKEFRTAPNNAAFLSKYREIIRREAFLFYSKNKRLCKELGYEVDDLISYGMCWSTTFAHRGQILDCEGDDNYRLLTRFLRQRYTEFYKSLLRERRGCLPSLEMLKDPTEQEIAGLEDEVEFEDDRTAAQRREDARAALEAGFAGMSRDAMIASLENAATGPMYGARRIAKRKLQELLSSEGGEFEAG